MGAIISVRELSAKRWKGSHVGEVWGVLLGNCGASQFTDGGVALAGPSPDRARQRFSGNQRPGSNLGNMGRRDVPCVEKEDHCEELSGSAEPAGENVCTHPTRKKQGQRRSVSFQ